MTEFDSVRSSDFAACFRETELQKGRDSGKTPLLFAVRALREKSFAGAVFSMVSRPPCRNRCNAFDIRWLGTHFPAVRRVSPGGLRCAKVLLNGQIERIRST